MTEDKKSIIQKKLNEKLQSVDDAVSMSVYNDYDLVDWQPLLAKECQVYVFNENYLAKRFDQINFQFCSKEVAKEILIDNLYALLRYKYFKKRTDESENKIEKIVKSFVANLKTTLIKVSFDKDSECCKVKWLPDGCIAFRNGVYNFREDEWLFQYDKIRINHLNSTIYMYDQQYIITWFINIDFIPIGINVNDFDIKELVAFLKDFDKESKNYCFELVYNMSHDYEDKFSYDKFKHMCEILGYLCLQSFSQLFVLLIGSGQNGKNSLIDGCFTSRVIPQPANNDLESIEDDKFVGSTLENRAHNIYLETSPDVKTKSKNLKALTGSMYQTVEEKGVTKHATIVNCKYIWAGNDQDKIKFSDNTVGFRRRINLYETWYRWDSKKRFLKAGDYYDTTFSDDLKEIKEDISNTIIFIYLAMWGIKNGTNDYTHSFKFSFNDWKLQYTDVNFDLKEKIEAITIKKIADYASNPRNREMAKLMFYDLSEKYLWESLTLKENGILVNNFDEFITNFLKDDEAHMSYFVEYDVYMSVRALQEITKDVSPAATFSQNLKKLYGINTFLYKSGNRPYVKVRFMNNKLKVLN